jgi:hypothetical protein
MKKKMFLAVALIALMAVGAFAQAYNAESDFQVTKTATAITITGFVGTGVTLNVSIPPKIQNLPVTVIGQNAFVGKTNIASVTIPDGVTTIGPNAFANCINLASVTIPSTVNDIMMSAFSNCVRLTSVTFLGAVPSSGFPSTAFIGDLRAKHLAGGLGTYTRNDTTWTLTPAAAATQNSGTTDGFKWERVGDGIRITEYAGTATAARIPDKINNSPVVVIGAQAFMNTVSITSVVIPNTVTTIEAQAFSGQTKLTSVTLSTSLVEIEKDAFNQCSALTSISLPATIKTIGAGAFTGCAALTTVTIPASVTSITFPSAASTRPAFYRLAKLDAASKTALQKVGYKE